MGCVIVENQERLVFRIVSTEVPPVQRAAAHEDREHCGKPAGNETTTR
jgi:hypothetical protein